LNEQPIKFSKDISVFAGFRAMIFWAFDAHRQKKISVSEVNVQNLGRQPDAYISLYESEYEYRVTTPFLNSDVSTLTPER